MRLCSSLPGSLLLLTAALGAACPLLGPLSAPGKALLAPIVFHGRLSGLARRGPAVQQATFKIDRVLKGLSLDTRAAVVEFALKNSSTRCRGVSFDEKGLRLAHRYVVFAARKKRQRMIAVAAPEPYSKRRAVARVLCAECAKAPSVKGLNDDVRVDMHAKLKLKCRISGNPPPRVIWFKNGIRLKADGRIKLRSKRRYSHLVINRVSLEDAGHYKCIAKNILGNATAFANVITTTATTESPFWHLRKDPCPEKNFCLNGGVCIYFKVVKEYACECADGYGGQRCETKVISTLSIDFQD